MKFKVLIVLFITGLSISLKAQDTVSVFMNGVLAGQYTIKKDQAEGGIWYKKAVYKKKMDELTIQIKGKNATGYKYKRTLDVTDDKDKSLYIAAETTGIFGQFEIPDKDVKKRLSKGKAIRFYLIMDPAGNQAKLKPMRLYMGSLSAK
jgi:hypothetical protein